MNETRTIELQHANAPLDEDAIRKALNLDEFVKTVTDALKSGDEIVVNHKQEGTGPRVVHKPKR
jgi:hypothetical protein